MRKQKTGKTVQGKRIVSVCSPMPASGVTMTAAALACVLAEGSSACFAEVGKPYVFDAYGLGKKFLLSGFTDFFQFYATGQPFRGPENLWHGVNWAVRPGSERPGQYRFTDAADILRFAERLPGTWSVLDCSGLAGDVLEGVLAGSDRTFLVVDPLPGKLIPATPDLQRLKYAFPGAVLAVNRLNAGIHKGELDAYLGTSDYLALPQLDARTVYQAEYACVLPWDLPEGKKLTASLKKHE